jgi:hypothetical protein
MIGHDSTTGQSGEGPHRERMKHARTTEKRPRAKIAFPAPNLPGNQGI